VCILWGSTYLGIRVALESWPPLMLGAVRFLVAGAALYAYARARGEAPPTRVEWRSALVTGALFFVVGNGFVNIGERSVSSGLTAVLLATMPLWMTMYARLFGHPVSRGEIVGVILGVVGVVVLNADGELRARPAGAVFLLLAPMGWALGSIASQRMPLPRGTMRIAAQMLAGGAALVLLSTGLGERMTTAPSFRSIMAVAYLVVFGSLVGFSAYSLLLRHTRPIVATSYAYVNPIVAVLLGALLAGETFGPASLAGSAIILAAVVLVGVARSRATPAESPVRAAAPASSERDERARCAS
jgi:drug/metabolite transporter (DMT)-like permease